MPSYLSHSGAVHRSSRPLTLLLALALAVSTVGSAGAASPAAASSAAAPSAAASTVVRPTAERQAAGEWQVLAVGEGRYVVRWTASQPLPAGSDRPTITGSGLGFGPSTVRPDGRTVEAVVTAETAPEPDDLDVVLSGDRLDEPGTDASFRTGPVASAAPVTAPLDAPDPGEPGPYETVTDDYRLPDVKVAGLRTPVEMLAHVVEPVPAAATGPRPLVLFMHGRHGVCYDPDDDGASSPRWPCSGRFEEVPSYLGYDYLQQLLASQGYATASVSVNGINAQDDALTDGGADARAVLVERHLDHWAGIAAEHRVDLDQVVLVGHSRGGEGVDRAAIQIPLSAPYRIAGQVLLAPTDFASHTAPYVPTVTVLPYCDGDVFDLQGQRFTDTARDLVPGDTALKSSVLAMGANHNFFNTEWTPGTSAAPSSDDWSGPANEPCGRRSPERLGAAEQRDVASAYVAGAVHLFTGDGEYLPLVDGSAVSVPSAGEADVRSHAVGGGRTVRRPGIEATPTLPAGGAVTRLCNGRAPFLPGPITDCLRRSRQVTPHWVGWGETVPTRRFLELSWSRAGAVGGVRFDRPLDLSEDRLELRTIVDPRPGDPVDLRVRVSDGSGGSATLVPVGGRTVEPLPAAGDATKWWAQAVLVDATDAGRVDLSDVRSVELVGGPGGGRVWVADVAAAPSVMVPVPATRAPQVNLGELTIDEGDPPGPRPVTRTARVPFTITGEVSRPSSLLVATAGQSGEGKQRFTVDVAPGQTSGSIPVRYVADRVDTQFAYTLLSVWPQRGLATDDYLGLFELRDDDPTPRARTTLQRRVREGESVTLSVRLAEPVGYDVHPSLSVVRGPGPHLRGTDVRRTWLSRQGVQGELDRPLWRLGVAPVVTIVAGRTTARVEIPIRRDRVRERTERVTAEARDGISSRVRTLTVAVRDRR